MSYVATARRRFSDPHAYRPLGRLLCIILCLGVFHNFAWSKTASAAATDYAERVNVSGKASWSAVGSGGACYTYRIDAQSTFSITYDVIFAVDPTSQTVSVHPATGGSVVYSSGLSGSATYTDRENYPGTVTNCPKGFLTCSFTNAPLASYFSQNGSILLPSWGEGTDHASYVAGQMGFQLLTIGGLDRKPYPCTSNTGPSGTSIQPMERTVPGINNSCGGWFSIGLSDLGHPDRTMTFHNKEMSCYAPANGGEAQVTLTVSLSPLQGPPPNPANQSGTDPGASPAYRPGYAPGGEPGAAPPSGSAPEVDLEDVVGRWSVLSTNTFTSTMKTVTISIKDLTSHTLVLSDTYTDWTAEYTPTVTPALLLGTIPLTEHLVFRRVPTADQMADATSERNSTTAPRWARVEVQGTLTWVLDLRLKRGVRPRELILEGEFYPGLISWSVTQDAETSSISSRTASVAGKGIGRPVRYDVLDDGQ
jgi:hypothetical protein